MPQAYPFDRSSCHFCNWMKLSSDIPVALVVAWFVVESLLSYQPQYKHQTSNSPVLSQNTPVYMAVVAV
jgi:hypothetical protein